MRCLMDTLRMLAYRAELELARQLAPHLSKPETAHEVVRHTLFASEANIETNRERMRYADFRAHSSPRQNSCGFPPVPMRAVTRTGAS